MMSLRLAMRGVALCAASLLTCASIATAQTSAPPASPQAEPARGLKVLKYAFPIAETGFDPAQITDIYSRYVTAHIFETPLRYDHLARPFKLKPSTAASMPEVSADAKTWTIRLKPGIYFQDDPAFKGAKRELTAHDYVYAFKRFYDPKVKAPYYTFVSGYRIVGLQALRDDAEKNKTAFDYDRPIEGLQALDRYTFQVKLERPNPRFIYILATNELFGAVAREVVEAYGDRIMEHPVGTGPFRLAEWRRSSRIVVERNPGYRESLYDETPNADDVEGQQVAARLRGRRLPLVDRVEVAIIEEQQPRWLSFLNAEHDFVDRLPNEFVNVAVPNGELAPNLHKRGVRKYRSPGADITLTTYNMDDPVVGGYTPDRIALRRALNLATDIDREIRLVRRGQALPAQSIVPPLTVGFDPDFKSENGEYSVARAKALLDMVGYVDRDGDGWREQPDGSPLTIEMRTEPDQLSRQFDELYKRNLDAINIRSNFIVAKWPENLKQSRAGKFQIWKVGSTAASPDGQQALERAYGPSAGGQNLARFKLPEFDRVFDELSVLPEGPERLRKFHEAKVILIAYAPYKVNVHRIITDLAHGWVIGYKRPPFWQNYWEFVDIDDSARPGAAVR